MTSTHQKLLLSSLGYSGLDKLDLSSSQGFRHLVAWLEHTKIRNYAQEARAEISNAQSPGWQPAFQRYLEDLDCPLDFDAASAERPEVMDWLLHYAVDLIYEDNAERVKDALAPTGPAPMELGGNAPSGPAYTDLGQPSVREAVAALLHALGLEPNQAGSPLSQQLAAAKRALSEQVLPALKDAQQQQQRQGQGMHNEKTGDAAADGGALLDLAQFPLGFSTGDAQVDAAATILRMLLIKDLRGLQTQIDDMIVQVQEFTANPRVSVGLGKVGR